MTNTSCSLNPPYDQVRFPLPRIRCICLSPLCHFFIHLFKPRNVEHKHSPVRISYAAGSRIQTTRLEPASHSRRRGEKLERWGRLRGSGSVAPGTGGLEGSNGRVPVRSYVSSGSALSL